LVKHELLTKQADVVEEIIPYILSIKAGNDEMLKRGILPTAEEMAEIENEIKNVKEKKLKTYGKGTTTGKFNYSVDLEHLLPDMTKFLNEAVVAPLDRNLLASLGLIELQGFAKSREETVFNPKVLVEEIKDAVADTAMIYQEIAMQILERNKFLHSRLVTNNIEVVPGTIKAFITNDMKILARSAYDRGVLDKKSFVEDFLDLNFETIVTRRDIERRRNLIERTYPYVIMNQEQNPADLSPEETKEQSPEKIKTEKDIEGQYDCLDPYCNAVLEVPEETTESCQVQCPDCGNITHFYELNARKHREEDKKKKKRKKVYNQAPYEKIDDLPDSVKNVLPVGAQMIWLRVFNSVLDKTGDEERAIKSAWSSVSEKYKKVEDKKKWVKK
jgi:cation transport regulator